MSMNQEFIDSYKEVWKNARDQAERELEYLYSKVLNDDYDFSNYDPEFLIPAKPEEVLPDVLDQGEVSEDDAQSNRAPTTTTKEEFIINQEIKKELIREVDYKGETISVYRITYQNGDVYEGEIENDLKEGSGIYFYENGEKYDGYFQEDLIHGYGKYFFLGGHKYEGEWVGGQKQGFGILEFTSGDRYHGEFRNDTFEGKGTFNYSNGDTYNGSWSKGKRNGHGEFTTKEGRVQIGEWVDNELQPF